MAGPGKPVQKAADGGQDGGSMRIDARLVQELAELLDKNGLTEIEVADGDRRIRVGRGAAPVAAPAAAPQSASSASSPASSGDVQPAAPEVVSGETIKSPMVGTAFLSPEPGSAPFIKVGDPVKAGDTLLIIEAMKVMNPITAPHGGVVKSILIADAHPVEFDQPLLVLG